MKTKVTFHKHPTNGDFFAYFPDEETDVNGNKTCYSHVGQHGSAHPDYVGECETVSPDSEEARALIEELQSIGYELNF